MISRFLPVVLLFLGFALYAASFEPFGAAECAYVFSALLMWAAASWKMPAKSWALCSLFGAWAAWLALLAWLRFVYPPSGYFFALALSLILALFFWVWLLALKKFLPSAQEGFLLRLSKILFLSGLWVALEWIRSFIFTGFPWLLLAHSQWLRPAAIQASSIGGAYLVSFILIFFGLALGVYGLRVWAWHRSKIEGGNSGRFGRLTPEFYIAALMVMAGVFMYISDLPKKQNAQKLFRVGLVQTDFAGILNWDASMGRDNLQVLKNLTLSLKKAEVDIVAWSESATPPMWPVIGAEGMRQWCEDVASDLGAPIIMGNGAYFNNDGVATSYNAAFYVSEKDGLDENFYAKQKLVPFGEYLPSWCFFLKEAVIPVGGMAAGQKSVVFDCLVKNKIRKISPIICYEDIFPQLGRSAAKAGAEILYVCTNDSWYGREGGAWQHAAHSAFQAASLRKPLIRASVNGLSGVFDQYGRLVPCFAIRSEEGGIYDGSGASARPFELVDADGNQLLVKTLKIARGCPLANDEGSIYFRGAGYADLVSYKNFEGVETFYAKYGDWLPKLCLAYAIIFLFLNKNSLTKLSIFKR
ncbi:MAG: apolipoprotein N-acyltransferase [Opitutales bacterium]|nr:apolipoprotein N-acyltransferase [Opitutales bacterium]